MARRRSTKTKRPIEAYQHTGKERTNNPPVGLVTPNTDPDAGPHLDPRTIIKAVRKQDGPQPQQLSLFAQREENPPIRQAIEFYRHQHNWSNRLVAGDFELGKHRRIAVKIGDDRGIESLKVMEAE